MSDSVQPHRWQPTRLLRPWDSPGKNTGVGCHFLLQCMKVKIDSEVAQSCPTFSDPMDYSLPGSSVYGILQARVLEWGAIAFSNCIVHRVAKSQTRLSNFHFHLYSCWFLWSPLFFSKDLCPKYKDLSQTLRGISMSCRAYLDISSAECRC